MVLSFFSCQRLKIEKEREREIKEGEISQFPEVTVVNTTADFDRLNNTNSQVTEWFSLILRNTLRVLIFSIPEM